MALAINQDDLANAGLMQNRYVEIPVALIRENNWNPNAVPKELYDSLVYQIRKDGNNADQPIIVREIDDSIQFKYEVLDGAHRLRALKECAVLKAVCVIRTASDKESRMKTIAMNKLRGSFDNIELAQLINELKQSYGATDTEIMAELGYTEQEMQDFDELVNFDVTEYDDTVPELPEGDVAIGTPEEIVLTLSKDQRELLETIPGLFNLSDMPAALIALAQYIQDSDKAGVLDRGLLQEAAEL